MLVGELKALLNYNPDTGVFTRLTKCRGHAIGEISGTPLLHGHISIGINYKKYLAHRLAWLYMTGKFPVNQIDHIDGNPSNNRFQNLRESTQAENTQNRRGKSLGAHKCNRSNKWIAKIMLANKLTYIGSYDNEEDAHNAYVNKKRQLHLFNTI